MGQEQHIAILGAGNIGTSIATGLLESGALQPGQMILTRRQLDRLDAFAKKGVVVSSDNKDAVQRSQILIIAVEPQQLDTLMEEISSSILEDQHSILSVVTGVSIKQIRNHLAVDIPIVRAMPNTAISLRQSITCISSSDPVALQIGQAIFDTVGTTVIIEEEMMGPATALGACGIAFFLRAIRAASQGGIEIGFQADQAMMIAAQVAKGAASLIMESGQHPESEIDRVTTPRGVTISGLNQMEHEGFSSAMIKGIVTSATKAEGLYQKS